MSRTSMSASGRESRSRWPRALTWIGGVNSAASITIAGKTGLATLLCGVWVSAGAGCGAGPRHFRAIENPSAVFRARAATLGEKLPDRKVIPKLIEHLEDEDPMVRLTANQELLRRTGRDFRFVPWGDAEERARSVAQWKAWWSSEQRDSGPERERRRP